MKPHAMRTVCGVSGAAYLVLAAVPAVAQNPSYEGRGYGGPLQVGPNFEQGGQHTPPVYGQKPPKKPGDRKAAPEKRAKEVTKIHKAPVEKETSTPQEPAASEKASSTVEPSTDTTPTSEGVGTSSAGSPSTAATCKKFDPTAGQTIPVPCD